MLSQHILFSEIVYHLYDELQRYLSPLWCRRHPGHRSRWCSGTSIRGGNEMAIAIVFGHVVLLLVFLWILRKIVKSCGRVKTNTNKGDTPIKPSEDCCPCSNKVFRRVARCDDRTDFLNIHYDICDHCGFETYAHNDIKEKTRRWIEYGTNSS